MIRKPVRETVRAAFPLLVLLMFSGYAAPSAAHGQGGVRLRVDAVEITLNGRVQMQFNTTSVDDEAPTQMILRRVRFGANVRVNDVVSGRVQPEFAGSTIALADAYMQLDVDDALVFQAGKFFRPFAVMEQTSSNQILPIERAVRIRGLNARELSGVLSGLGYSDRDIGLLVRGAPDDAPLDLIYVFGVFAGPLQGSVDEFTQQYVARLGFSPLEDFRFGVAWSRRDFAPPSPDPSDELEAGNAFVADFEYGGPTPVPGPHIVVEAAIGDYQPFLDQEFSGVQAWLGYRAEAGRALTLIEPIFRVSHASIDDVPGAPAPDGTLLTPGLNLYFGGLNRILFNYDIWLGEDDEDASSFKAQFQFVF